MSLSLFYYTVPTGDIMWGDFSSSGRQVNMHLGEDRNQGKHVYLSKMIKYLNRKLEFLS